MKEEGQVKVRGKGRKTSEEWRRYRKKEGKRNYERVRKNGEN